MLVCCVQASMVTAGAVASMQILRPQFRAGHGLGDGAGSPLIVRLMIDL